MGKVLTFLILGAIGVYVLLFYKPGIYFNKKADHGMFTLHARGSLPEDFDRVLDAAEEKIKSADIYSEEIHMDLYLPSSGGQYSFFTPWARDGEYFRHNPFTGAVFLAAADFPAREARPASGSDDARDLGGVIAAAGAFELTRRKLRPLSYISMHEWKVRGYGEIVSGGTGWFNMSDACSRDDRPGLTDYRYGRMLDQILKQENMFYNDFLGRSFSYKIAEKRFRQDNCGG